MSSGRPNLKYLLACSEESLESFELSRLNRASNLRKELSQVAEEWVDAEVASRLARWIVERRRAEFAPTRIQAKRSVRLSSRNQSTLLLPFPRESDDADLQSPPARRPSKTVGTTSKSRRSGLVRTSKEREGETNDMSGLDAARQPRMSPVSKMIPTLVAILPPVERTFSRCIANSAQAVKSLRALDAIACGPPEPHSRVRNFPAASLCPLQRDSETPTPSSRQSDTSRSGAHLPMVPNALCASPRGKEI